MCGHEGGVAVETYAAPAFAPVFYAEVGELRTVGCAAEGGHGEGVDEGAAEGVEGPAAADAGRVEVAA